MLIPVRKVSIDHDGLNIWADDFGDVAPERPLERRLDRICEAGGKDVRRNVSLDRSEFVAAARGKVEVGTIARIFLVELFYDQAGIAAVPDVDAATDLGSQFFWDIKRVILNIACV